MRTTEVLMQNWSNSNSYSRVAFGWMVALLSTTTTALQQQGMQTRALYRMRKAPTPPSVATLTAAEAKQALPNDPTVNNILPIGRVGATQRRRPEEPPLSLFNDRGPLAHFDPVNIGRMVAKASTSLLGYVGKTLADNDKGSSRVNVRRPKLFSKRRTGRKADGKKHVPVITMEPGGYLVVYHDP